jgi:RimJ/RimL family protein N-acetyltransferase
MTATEQVNSLGLELSIQRFPDEDLLATTYVLLKCEGQLPVIWHHRTPPTLTEFLELTKLPDVIYYACMARDIETRQIDIAGLGWAINLVPLGVGRGFRGNVGMAFLKKFWRRGIAKELATQCLDDLFMQCNVEALHGITPVVNLPAVRFIEKMGFYRVGVAPMYMTYDGEPCSAVLSCMSREMWNRPREG